MSTKLQLTNISISIYLNVVLQHSLSEANTYAGHFSLFYENNKLKNQQIKTKTFERNGKLGSNISRSYISENGSPEMGSACSKDEGGKKRTCKFDRGTLLKIFTSKAKLMPVK